MVLEKTPDSLLDCKIKPVNLKVNLKSTLNTLWKDWCWSWTSNSLATWSEQSIHRKRPWRWKRLRAWGEGDNRGWDGWMASWIRWTWTWANFRRWWGTEKPGVLQSMELWRVGHGLAIEQWQPLWSVQFSRLNIFTLLWKRHPGSFHPANLKLYTH